MVVHARTHAEAMKLALEEHMRLGQSHPRPVRTPGGLSVEDTGFDPYDDVRPLRAD